MEAVRSAVSGDLSRLEELLVLAVQATTNDRGASLFRHPEREDSNAQRLQNTLASPDRLLLAGLVDEYIVGVAIVSVDQAPKHGHIAIVEELYVEEEARGVGVGEAMLDAAVLWARQNDCVGIDIAALPGDRAAKNLCERSGFRARLLLMHRSLTD